MYEYVVGLCAVISSLFSFRSVGSCLCVRLGQASSPLITEVSDRRRDPPLGNDELNNVANSLASSLVSQLNVN